MTVELRDQGDAERWLTIGLGLTRLVAPSPDELATVTPWLRASIDDLPALPPPGVIADLGRLLGGRSLTLIPTPVPAGAARLRAALRRYEDDWLAAVAADARINAAADAWAKLPPALHAAAVALVAASVLVRIGFTDGVTVSNAIARRLLNRPPSDTFVAAQAALAPLHDDAADEVVTLLAQGYEGLARAARQASHLLDDPDVFALENLTVLKSLSQRVAIAQVLEAAGELKRALPKRLKGNAQSTSTGFVPTRLEDDSAYPVGGFSSMSTAGSLENLVTSELIYMDEEEQKVDLFDMRYVEGELLYYTRDEAILVRRRRSIAFVLDAELVSARYKDPGLRWQRLVTLLGVIAASAGKLYEWLAEEALMMRVLFVRDALGGSPLGAERALAELFLGEWIEKGVAEVRDATLVEIAAETLKESNQARVQLVLVGAPTLQSAWQLADGSKGRVTHVLFDVAAIAPSWADWVEASLALLKQLL